MSRGVPALHIIHREPIMPSTSFNSSRGPSPGVGARQLVGNTLELSLMSRNSDQSSRASNSSYGSARIRNPSSGAAASGSECELEQTQVGSIEQTEPTSVASTLELPRKMISRFKEPLNIDTPIHRPSPAPVSLPDVCPPSGTGPDGVVLSAPVLVLESKLRAFEQQHRFVLGSLDREYHSRSAIARLIATHAWHSVTAHNPLPSPADQKT
jgi:hypothetical protein